LAAVSGCSSSTPAAAVTTVASVSAEAPASSDAQAGVTSTLDGLSTLPHRVHWEAKPSVDPSDVRQIDFLVDSQLAWTELRPPYFYGDDGNWLVTSFLTPGSHEFEARLATLDGQVISDKVTATVGEPTLPPPALSGTWSRVVAAADLAKATSGQPPPAGLWTLTISDVGLELGDPQGGGIQNDVAYISDGQLELRPTIEVPPYPNEGNGAFCHEPDPDWAWTYTASPDGHTITLHPVGKDPCGDRVAIYEGTWTRTT
jgi:hypothetical protein